MVRARPPTGAKLVGGKGQDRCQGGYLASKTVVLKEQSGGVHRVHLSLDALPFFCTSSAEESSAGASIIPLQITFGRPKVVRRQVCCQRPCNGGLGMPDLENHWFSERLAYLVRSLSKDTVWRQRVSDTFPCLKSDLKAEGQRNLRGEAPFVCECRKALRNLSGFSDLFQYQKELYRELVVGFVSDPFVDRLSWSMK